MNKRNDIRAVLEAQLRVPRMNKENWLKRQALLRYLFEAVTYDFKAFDGDFERKEVAE